MFGNLKRILNKWRRIDYTDIDPDLIFLDSKNLPEFDLHQLEGRLEKPISSRAFSIFYLVCFLIIFIFIFKVGSLQIVNGSDYRERSENNKLKQILIFAPRGIIFSRNGEQLAWNQQLGDLTAKEDFPKRKYSDKAGLGNLLGFIKYPAKDKAGFFYEEEYLPKDGLELYLNEMLAGKNGLEFIETSVDGKVVSQSVVQSPKIGTNAVLSIDSRIQEKFYKTIQELANRVGFQGGAGIIMDVRFYCPLYIYCLTNS
jgi:cell division protein FtsI/penicillin-binding protein 2